MDYTPYSLSFAMEVVVSVEMELPTLRILALEEE